MQRTEKVALKDVAVEDLHIDMRYLCCLNDDANKNVRLVASLVSWR